MGPEDELHSYMPAYARCPAWLEGVCAAVILGCVLMIGWDFVR